MAHIPLPDGLPGISGPLRAYPDTAQHLLGLAQTLLRGPSSLTPAEREMIATYVSNGNECRFCTQSHAAAARELYGDEREVVAQTLMDKDAAPISDKLKALLTIADKTRRDGRLVTAEDAQRARDAGADDEAMHRAVLIAAAFCMYNRYVEGLGTWASDDAADYEANGRRACPSRLRERRPLSASKRHEI